jgi:hypothetical protein
MSEFTHARCGGVLVEIEKPDWWPNRMARHGYNDAVMVRCERCNRPGELARGPERNNPPLVVGGLLKATP